MMVYCKTAPRTTLPGDLATAAKSCTAASQAEHSMLPQADDAAYSAVEVQAALPWRGLLGIAWQELFATVHRTGMSCLCIREAAAAAKLTAHIGRTCHYLYMSCCQVQYAGAALL